LSYTVTVDASGLQEYMRRLQEKFQNIGDMITQFLFNRTVPTLSSQAGSYRKVHTGNYMNLFEATQLNAMAGVVTGVFYWKFLEWGTSRGIEPKPIIPEAIEQIRNEFADFLVDALDL
jgi:hypothetical protein